MTRNMEIKLHTIKRPSPEVFYKLSEQILFIPCTLQHLHLRPEFCTYLPVGVINSNYETKHQFMSYTQCWQCVIVGQMFSTASVFWFCKSLDLLSLLYDQIQGEFSEKLDRVGVYLIHRMTLTVFKHQQVISNPLSRLQISPLASLTVFFSFPSN